MAGINSPKDLNHNIKLENTISNESSDRTVAQERESIEDDDDLIVVWDELAPLAKEKRASLAISNDNGSNNFQALTDQENSPLNLLSQPQKLEQEPSQCSTSTGNATEETGEQNLEQQNDAVKESRIDSACSSRKRDYPEEKEVFPERCIGHYAKKLQDFDLRSISDMYSTSMQKVVVCLEVLDQTKAALTEISDELSAQRRLIDQAAVAKDFNEIVDAIDKHDCDVESMFGDEPCNDFRKSWDMFLHCRSLLAGISEQSFNLAAVELTKGKTSRNPSKECKIYFYPTKLQRGTTTVKSNWKSNNYTMGQFVFNAGMYFNKTTERAIIVIDCSRDPKIKTPLKWTLKCKGVLLIRNKIESENGQYYYTEKSIKHNFQVTFCRTSKKSTSRQIFTHHTGLTLSEIVNLDKGWIDLHTRTMDIEVDVKAE
ncbi:uncharacterized protein LOC142342132 [Convolutriloba macropyga]|uniref:uncharacterized protein LOC142342132 n=1 Tax=Convolutriloba macropyga TaxID=536237 RepID=UPI003F527C5C